MAFSAEEHARWFVDAEVRRAIGRGARLLRVAGRAVWRRGAECSLARGGRCGNVNSAAAVL
jgi:hypothetical protein